MLACLLACSFARWVLIAVTNISRPFTQHSDKRRRQQQWSLSIHLGNCICICISLELPPRNPHSNFNFNTPFDRARSTENLHIRFWILSSRFSGFCVYCVYGGYIWYFFCLVSLTHTLVFNHWMEFNEGSLVGESETRNLHMLLHYTNPISVLNWEKKIPH